MGTFFNPGNGSFTQDKNSEIYIDKTELLKFLTLKLDMNFDYLFRSSYMPV